MINVATFNELGWMTSFSKGLSPLGDEIAIDFEPTDCYWFKAGNNITRSVPPSANHRPAADGTWVPDIDAAWFEVRSIRDKLIAATDWRAVRAGETGEILSESWCEYRQALRDITKQSDPFNVIWPSPPSTPSER